MAEAGLGDAAKLPTGPNDIIEGDSVSFIVGVPNPPIPGVDSSGNTEFVSYLRLGQASPADEGFLQQDPAAQIESTPTTSTVPALIGTTASPFSDGGLSYTTGTAQFAAPYSYIRLGTHTTYETWLPTSTSSAKGIIAPPASGVPNTTFDANGVLIYSNDTVQIFSPTINQTTSNFSQWSADSLSVVQSGSKTMSATRTFGAGAWSATFQRLDQMNTTLGSITNAITGQSITQWSGNDASTGLGSLLWSNYGSTQNVFGGQIVNLINSGIDVQGVGETKITTNASIGAAESLVLYANPLNAATSALALAVGNKAAMVAGIVAAVAAAVADTVSDVAATEFDSSDAGMRTAMDVSFGAVAAASLAVLVIQAMAIVAGNLARAAGQAAQDTATTSLTLDNAGLTIRALDTIFVLNAAGQFTTTAVSQQQAAAVVIET